MLSSYVSSIKLILQLSPLIRTSSIPAVPHWAPLGGALSVRHQPDPLGSVDACELGIPGIPANEAPRLDRDALNNA